MFWFFLVSVGTAVLAIAGPQKSNHPIQYPIFRRAGSFPSPDVADLPYLLQELRTTESRFATTTIHLQEDGNSLREPKNQPGTQSEAMLLGVSRIGQDGNWFTTLDIGEPVQGFDLDLDMLTSDFLVWSTTSNRGSWFLDYKSSTYGRNSLNTLGI